MCAEVRMCKISHVHTCLKCVRCACSCDRWSLFAKICKNVCKNVCKSADVQNFTPLNTCEMCTMWEQVWLKISAQ